MLSLQDISMCYGKGEGAVNALKSINMTIEQGEFLAVLGKSGCGKSTLLNILGGICSPTTGRYLFNNECITDYSRKQLSQFRADNVGFVVQHFALIQDMTVYENISCRLTYQGYKKKDIAQIISPLLSELDLTDKAGVLASKLSGGQSQRVAIARAISGNPKLLLADEPTGALDEETGRSIMKIFRTLHQRGTTIVLVTHDVAIAEICTRKIHMRDGMIVS